MTLLFWFPMSLFLFCFSLGFLLVVMSYLLYTWLFCVECQKWYMKKSRLRWGSGLCYLRGWCAGGDGDRQLEYSILDIPDWLLSKFILIEICLSVPDRANLFLIHLYSYEFIFIFSSDIPPNGKFIVLYRAPDLWGD